MAIVQTKVPWVGDREGVRSRDTQASPKWQGFSWQHENPLLPMLPRNMLTGLRACYSECLPSKMHGAHFELAEALSQISSVELPRLSDQDKRPFFIFSEY